jgi:hypothetical protein
MGLSMNMLCGVAPVIVLALGLTQATCQQDLGHQAENSSIDNLVSAPSVPTSPVPTPQNAGTSSVMVYIKVGLDKKYGLLARLVGGKRNSTWQSADYDAANPWWDNPLIAYAEPAIPDADVVGRSDSDVFTGRGASRNVVVMVTLVPHIDVSVKTNPASDCIKGTATCVISTLAEYYDGRWVNMVREVDRTITFSFDNCDPQEQLEVIGHESRGIPPFALERYTRDQSKWEPMSDWPSQARREDWRVVIYGRDAVLEASSCRYVR